MQEFKVNYKGERREDAQKDPPRSRGSQSTCDIIYNAVTSKEVTL
jgi:hypothetical protein